MIISHRYRFIFLKTEKTASTSLNDALRRLVQESDDLHPADPQIRDALVRRHGSLAGVSFRGTSSAWRRKLPGLFGLHEHARARDVRAFLGPALFDQYTIVTSERNPWDRQVSLYSHRMSDRGNKDLSGFDRDMRSWSYSTLHYNRLNNWDIYSLGGRICAHHVIRYERLTDDFAAFLRHIGVDPARVPLAQRRATVRPRGDAYRDLYSPASQALVASWYRREIEQFGYSFDAA
jgi:hypothetical protein